METAEKAVAVVDHDATEASSLKALLESAGFGVRIFESGYRLLEQGVGARSSCVVADLRMPSLSGLDLLQRCRADRSLPPVILLTAHGDIALAVEAMKLGALDFIQKPCEPQRIVDAVTNAVGRQAYAVADDCMRADVQRRIETLSPRERDVLRSVLVRDHNKSVAMELGISVRTVEIHRSRVLKKMHAEGLPDLLRMMLSAKVAV